MNVNVAHSTYEAGAAGTAPDRAKALYRKVAWRLLPLLMLSYMVAYLDRVNIGYAQLQMKELLHFSDAVYGLGAGIFFVGYFLCEVPSNLLLEKIGARKTLLRIMLCWGVVASAMMLVATPMQFYVMRFVLGIFEAGFFPGVVLYFTYWFPVNRRGKVLALFMTAAIVASLISGPLSGVILHYLDRVAGLAGWQWLFLTQGFPAVLLGAVLYLRFTDKPEQAAWLSAEEKAMIQADLAADAAMTGTSAQGIVGLLRDPKLYIFALGNFLMIGGSYALVFWAPSLIRSWGVQSLTQVGIYAAIPNIAGIVGMVVVGRHSDKRRERRWHYVFCSLLAAAGLGVTSAAGGMLLPAMAGLSLAMLGIAALVPLYMAMVTEYFPRDTCGTAIAAVTSVGILGGGISSALTGLLSSRFGGVGAVLYLVIAFFVLSALVVLAATRTTRARASA